jgi:hypothetical protein
MKRRYVFIGLAVIAALAIASPVFGISSSLKKAIKKEVAKQVANATGPQGPPGQNGTPGSPGTPGSALAYAFVNSQSSPTTDTVNDALSKNVTDANVTYQGVGTAQWCINGLGFTPKNAVANGTGSDRVVAVQGLNGDSSPCAGDEQIQLTESVASTGALAESAFVVLIN